MQTRGRVRTEWRLGVYRASLEFCQTGGFSLSRFVAVPVERLRLSGGESAARPVIPICIDAAFRREAEEAMGALARALGADAPLPGPQPAGTEATLGGLDLALVEGRLDPRRAAEWMARSGLRLQQTLTEALAKGFALVGRHPAGEEIALLCLFSLEQALQQAAMSASADGQGAQGPVLACAALLLERASALAAEHPSVDARSLTARCGLRAALLQSHLAFQRSVELLLAHTLNTYRTSPAAVRIARGLIRSEADLLAADEVIGRVASALLSTPDAVEQAWIEGATELVREALAEPYATVQLPAEAQLQLAAAFAEPGLFAELVRDHEQRERLLQQLSRVSPPGPLLPATDLLRQVGALRAARRRPGEPLPRLPHGGTLGGLAQDQARGAWLLAADTLVRKSLAPLVAALQPGEGAQAEREWKRGQRYRFGAGPWALLNPAGEERRQAQLFVDLRELVGKTLRLRPDDAAGFLRTELFEPVLAETARLRTEAGGDDAALALSLAPGDSLAFRGEILAVVELALAISYRLSLVREKLESAADARAGAQQGLQQAKGQLAHLSEERRLLEERLATRIPDHERDSLESRLRETAAAENELLVTLQDQRESLIAGGLAAGMFITFGPPASVVALAHPELGSFPLCLAERLDEAARCTVRSPLVQKQRARWSATARGRPLAFAVSVASGAALRLPLAAGHQLDKALERGDAPTALRALGAAFKEAQAELQRSAQLSGFDATPALYNEGCALSSEALTALRAAGVQRFTFRDLQIAPQEIDPALKAQLAFPPGEPLVLVLASDPQSRKLVLCFRHAGAARFEGLPKATEVWELCDPQGPFVALLARHQPGLS